MENNRDEWKLMEKTELKGSEWKLTEMNGIEWKVTEMKGSEWNVKSWREVNGKNRNEGK